MRVYFAPCGIGLGHVGRTVPIAKMLMQHEHAQIVFSTYQEGAKYIEEKKLPLIEAPAIGVKVKLDGTIDLRRTATHPGPFIACFTILHQINAEIGFMEKFAPDVVVSDSRASSLIAAKMLGIPSVCILNQFQPMVPRRQHHLHLAKTADYVTLTLIGRIWVSARTILIPDFPPPYTISAGNLNIPKSYKKKVKLIGPILEVHPNELATKQELRKSLGLPADDPVVFVPVSGPVREKAFLAGVLRKILLEFPKNYEVVMSLGYPEPDSKPTRRGNVTIFKWLPNRFEYLKASDIVIARAGHGTITQAMCYGKPLILVPTPNHTEQINNAKKAQDVGAARILMQQDLNRTRLLKTVEQLLEEDTSHKLEAVHRETLEQNGVEEAAETIRRMA